MQHLALLHDLAFKQVKLTKPLVAIDVAKLRHYVLIEAPGWKSRKRMVLLNTTVEFRRFAHYLHSLKHPVRIGFEATGNYLWPTFSRPKGSSGVDRIGGGGPVNLQAH